MNAFHDRVYLVGDAVKGIAEAMRRDEDRDVVALGCALAIVGDMVSKIGEDLEIELQDAERRGVA